MQDSLQAADPADGGGTSPTVVNFVSDAAAFSGGQSVEDEEEEEEEAEDEEPSPLNASDVKAAVAASGSWSRVIRCALINLPPLLAEQKWSFWVMLHTSSGFVTLLPLFMCPDTRRVQNPLDTDYCYTSRAETECNHGLLNRLCHRSVARILAAAGVPVIISEAASFNSCELSEARVSLVVRYVPKPDIVVAIYNTAPS